MAPSFVLVPWSEQKVVVLLGVHKTNGSVCNMDALPKTVYVCIDIRWINIQPQPFCTHVNLRLLLGLTPLSLMSNLIACPKHARCRAPFDILCLVGGPPTHLGIPYCTVSALSSFVQWKIERAKKSGAAPLPPAPQVPKGRTCRLTYFDFVDNFTLQRVKTFAVVCEREWR